ncbi:MAG: Isopenicillin N epimerase [Chroococcopsis gigantea SAG 12.99]|nr:aminotransferase class V-fold PLP-dependent enzyme [Chlorogloea purpurea SAG 13.99]MDV3002364.1 Isopenicillin N epimerase [Chroococcopsis gigantea SAG 12.99]
MSWLLDSNICFLNHGSYGAVPQPVLQYQQAMRERMEKQPLQFLGRDLEDLLDDSRGRLADFIGVNKDDLVFVPNATVAVNSVLRSLVFEAGDEILVTDHIYNACGNAVNYLVDRYGVKLVLAKVPFPPQSSAEIIAPILDKVSPRTKLALLDHVTSATALIFPIEELVARLKARGVDTLVDGAHALGFLPLDVGKIGATYYTGNCHKWLCAPKGAAFLHVVREKQNFIRPLSISHGANSTRNDRSRFQLEFTWTGTDDPTAYLSVPQAIDFLHSLYPGGFLELVGRNHDLAVAGRKIICESLDVPPPCPESLIGAMASIPLGKIGLSAQELNLKLLREYNIEVPIVPWYDENSFVRISAQYYNYVEQYEYLARCLREVI